MMRQVNILVSLVFLSVCALVFAGGQKEGAQPAGPVTLQYWSSGGGELQMNAIKGDLSKKYPNIAIEIFGASHADFWKKMTVALASDTGPDFCHSKNFYMMEFAAKGALLPLDEFYKKDTAEMKPEGDPLFKEGVETEGRVNGKLYGLPIYSWWIAFMYNADLLKEAGYAGPPPDWAALRAYATKLTKDTDGDGKIDQWGTKMYTYSRSEIPQFNWDFNQFVLQNGLDMVKLSPKLEPTYNFTAPEAVEALQYWVDNIYQYKNTLPPELSEKDATKIVENGKLAMWYMGHWAYNQYPKTAPKLNWKIGMIPKKKTATTVVEGHSVFAVKTTKHPKEVWAVLKYMVSPEGDLVAQKVAGYMPTRDQNWAKEPWSTREDYKASVAQVQAARYVQPLYPGMNAQLSKSAEVLQEALYNKDSVPNILKKMQDEVVKVLKQQ